MIAPDEEDSALPCRTAVQSPPGRCILQVLPGSRGRGRVTIFKNLTGVGIAGNEAESAEAVGDEVDCWAVPHLSWIGVEDTALPLVKSRPKLNRLVVGCVLSS